MRMIATRATCYTRRESLVVLARTAPTRVQNTVRRPVVLEESDHVRVEGYAVFAAKYYKLRDERPTDVVSHMDSGRAPGEHLLQKGAMQ